MKITILGCGGSLGVPVLGNEWGRCDPENPKNRRRRCSILVEKAGFTLLIDTSPDLREQLLDARVEQIDAVLFTHGHADHTHGIDDLRPLHWRGGAAIDVYGDGATLASLDQRFGYLFRVVAASPSHFRPPLTAHEITLEPFDLGGIHIQPIHQDHGTSGESLGFIIDSKFAYSTDVAIMDTAQLDRLHGIETWVVDCLRESGSRAHADLAQTLSWLQHVQPKRAYCTHMTHDLDYEWLRARLPPGVEPAYDGLVLEI